MTQAESKAAFFSTIPELRINKEDHACFERIHLRDDTINEVKEARIFSLKVDSIQAIMANDQCAIIVRYFSQWQCT